jgi:hypothetical protein
MTDRSKFEQMLEHLINDNEAKARELFHDIVVAKSREIYENLLADDFEEEETDENMDMEPEENMEMGMGPEEEAMGGDETDDMLGDVESDDDTGGDDFGGDEMGDDDMGMGGEEELGDRLDDLEAELEALKDEFENLMGGEEGEEGDMGDEEFGGDKFGGDDMGDEEEEEKEGMYFEKRDEDDEEDEDEEEDKQTDEDFIREYVEKVGGKDYTTFGKMGDDGVNTKSIVAGKNDMGGTAKNLNQGGTETPTFANQGQLKGNGVFKGSKPQLQDGGNINKPGGNAGKTAFKKKEPGHGAEKKGTGDNGDKSAGSPLNGAPGRAK